MRWPRAHQTQAWALGLVSVAAVVGMTTIGAGADTSAPVPGSAGTDTAIPATESAVTVSGRGKFSNLTITVNQTRELTTQAVSITWTGGTPTKQGPGLFAGNFLQVMQCWGDDDGTIPGNPGPPPEQCAFGASGARFGAGFNSSLPNLLSWTRIISRPDWQNFDPDVGVLDPRTTNVWSPFRAVDGTTIDVPVDPNFSPAVVGGNFWLNPYFNVITTNEIAAARSGPDGTGSEIFKVDNGLESPGLGCGQLVEARQDGSKTRPKCWIVVVPRGVAVDENEGTPFANLADQRGVATSPLSPSVWANRIAIPLEFRPVESPCTLSSVERRISGTELIAAALVNWQPALCAGGSLPPFSFAPVGDATARQQLMSGQVGSPGLVVVQRPLASELSTPSSPIVYAPLSVSGLVVGFNVERYTRLDAPPASQALDGVRVGNINLTPRLVAKLLTQSYTTQVTVGDADPGYDWVDPNPAHMGIDEDFLRFNSEFRLLQTSDSRTFSGLQVPLGNSDAAAQVWDWILADDEAAAWLAGEPDEWGMVVNPVYATDAARNPAGIAFGVPVPNSFPKAEPFCFQAEDTVGPPVVKPPLLCATDWMPYNRGFADGARIARVAFDGARINGNPFAQSSSDYWKVGTPQSIARKAMLSLTDSPSARQFGLQVARLSRADDNGEQRSFFGPDEAGLAAAVAAMSPNGASGLLAADPEQLPPGAYPLTTVTYGAIRPLSLTAAERSDFAAFLDFAATTGQAPGFEVGDLPRGYLPLPGSLAAVTTAAAQSVRNVAPPPPTTTTAVVPTTFPRPITVPTFRPTGGGGVIPVPTATTALPEESTTTTTTTEVPDVVEETSSTSTSTTVPVDTTAPPTTLQPVTAPVDAPGMRLAVAGLGFLAVGSALGALEITKRARRAPGAIEPLVGA